MIDAQAALAAANTALQTVADAFAEQSVTLSKLSLERDALAEANIALQAQLDTANATIAALTDPWREVDKSGLVDVTAKVQAILDKGSTKVPAGRYLVDPERPLMPKAGSRVEFAEGAVLVAKPNAAPKYYVMKVAADDVTIIGGEIQGERLLHTYTAGSTHEWGYGVMVSGNRCTIDGMKVAECAGDGFGVTGDYVELRNVVSTRNRRQGLSLFACKGFRAYDSQFTHTGALDGQAGTNPRCGVDVEPDAGWVEDAIFERCTITDNDVTAAVAWMRSEVVGGIRGLVFRDCTLDGVNAVHMKALAGSIEASVENCRIKRGSGSGLRIESGARVKVSGNTFTTPTDRADFSLTGTDTRTKYDIYTPSTSPGSVDVGTNRYV